MNLSDIQVQVGLALGVVGATLLGGKAFRRLVLLPFEWLARRTPSKVDDVLLSEAEKDLGIDNTLDKAEVKDVTKSKE